MFREIIIAEMERQGMSRYAIAGKIADQVPRSCTYRYLAGDGDMTGKSLAVLCEALGLTLKRSQGRK